MTENPRRMTDAQREAISLVAQGYESKEIARLIGVTHYAVNRRIERAVDLLGAKNRKDAARIFVQGEMSMCERIAHEPLPLESSSAEVTLPEPDSVGVGVYPWPWLSSLRGRSLSKVERLFWVFIGLPVIIMLAWGIFLSGIGALDVLKL